MFASGKKNSARILELTGWHFRFSPVELFEADMCIISHTLIFVDNLWVGIA